MNNGITSLISNYRVTSILFGICHSGDSNIPSKLHDSADQRSAPRISLTPPALREASCLDSWLGSGSHIQFYGHKIRKGIGSLIQAKIRGVKTAERSEAQSEPTEYRGDQLC